MKQLAKEFLPSSLLVVFMLIMSLVYGDTLPDRVPVHFDINGNPDRWEDKSDFLFMLPLIMVGVMAGVSIMLRISPKFFSMPNARGTLGSIYFGCAILVTGIHTGTLMDPTIGETYRTIFTLSASGFLLFVGNVLGKSERNFFLGIRLPWTIASDDNWTATHRLAGRLMVLGGVVLLGLSFFGPSMGTAILIMVLPLLTGCLYSFFYYWTRERGLENGL